MHESELTIAQINTLFDGVNGRSIVPWLLSHLVVLLLNSESMIVSMQERVADLHPIEAVIQESHTLPQIIIAHEVQPNITRHSTKSRGMAILESHGYTTHIGYRHGKELDRLARATVIATQLDGENIPISITGSGGGFVGLFIAELNTSVIAVHPAAFDVRTRERQIATIFMIAQEQQSLGRKVVIAGDFNTAFDSDNYQGFERRSVDSFPHPNMVELGKKVPYSVISYFADIFKPKEFDHIFVSDGIEIVNTTGVVTTSDHLGLVSDLRI